MRRFLRRNRSEVMFGAALVAVATAFAATGMAGTIGNDASSRSNVDSYVNFTIVDTNHPALHGGWITQFDYYAANTGPMAFVVVDGSNVVKWVGPVFNPSGTGAQTYVPSARIPVQAGWNVAIYSGAGGGVIPFEYVGSPAPYTPNNVGVPSLGATLSIEGTSGRTYSVVAAVLELTTTCSGPTASYPGFTQVGSTLFVDSSNAAATPGPLFVNGVKYKVEAAGVFDAGGDTILADAEYSQDATQATWTKYVNGYEPGPNNETANYLLDLRVNGDPIDWGVFSASHVYAHDFMGTGAASSFGFDVYDSYPSNNVGGLCVSVFKDNLAPVVSDIVVSSTNGSYALMAKADDTTRNGSNIASADYSLNGGATWLPMSAADGTFNAPTEAVKATFAGPGVGTSWSVCVKATDAAGNTSDPVCTSLKPLIEASGAIAPKVAGVLAPNYKTYGEKGEPDFALEAYVYDFGGVLGGAVTVNYKLLHQTCTFTPGTGRYDFTAQYLVASIRDWTNSCGGTVTMQFFDRTSTYPGFDHPRGAIFVDASINKYDVASSGINDPLTYGWVPVDRGNVHTEGT